MKITFIKLLKVAAHHLNHLKPQRKNVIHNITVSPKSFAELLAIRNKTNPYATSSQFIIINLNYILTNQSAELLAWCKRNLAINMSTLLTPTWFFIINDNKA